MSEYRVDPERDPLETGIYIRAKHPTEGWGAYDLFSLDEASVLQWLEDKSADNPGYAAQVVLALLGHR